MVQNFFDKIFHIERKEAQDIRDKIWAIVYKFFKNIPDELVQNIYVDLVLVFFGVKFATVSLPKDTRSSNPVFVAELQMRIPTFKFIYNEVLDHTGYYPLVIYNINKKSHVRKCLRELLNIRADDIRYPIIISKMFGNICQEDSYNKLQYRVLFNFTFNTDTGLKRPANVTTTHLECWCEELSGFKLISLMKRLHKLEELFAVYGYFEHKKRSNSRSSSRSSSSKNRSRIKYIENQKSHPRLCEYNINLEIGLKDIAGSKNIKKYPYYLSY
jgi:hypothetical protein